MGKLGTNQYKNLTLADCRQSAKSKMGKCLSSVYKNVTVPMKWECRYGHSWKTPYMNIRAGTWCRECQKSKNKTPIDFLNKEAKKRGGKCLSKKIKGSLNLILWECSKKHRWKASISNFLRKGNWCAKCVDKTYLKLSIKECSDFAKKLKIKLLSTTYENSNTPMEWACSLGHRWVATWAQLRVRVKKGREACLVCYQNNRVRYTRVNIKDCKKLAKNKKGKFLEKVYKGSNIKMLWECKAKHTWCASYSSVKSGSWCPKCRIFKKEEECRDILEKITGLKFKKVRPKWLRSCHRGILELDGYNFYHKIAFEYDGEQHYFSTHLVDKKRLLKIQKRDALKNSLCVKHGVKLIRIPYWVKNKKDFIIKKLKKIGFIFKEQP